MSELENLRDECLACRKCAIGGVQVDGAHLSNVFSNMNDYAKVMVVGQNPGRTEVEQGEPFVGPSGAFFDQALERMVGISRADVYISNVVRCYTPDNRPPRQGEKDNCREFLDREVEIVDPKVIIALGAPAFKQLTGMSGIMKHSGERIFSPRYGRFVVPVLHPSPRNVNDPVKRDMFMDALGTVRELLDG